jgi:hypothetical protein
VPSASARADSAPRRFRCGSLLLAADSAHKWTIVHFLRQGCRWALVRWDSYQSVCTTQGVVSCGAVLGNTFRCCHVKN